MNAVRRAVGVVLDRDLTLGVRPNELQDAGASHLSVVLDEAVRQVDGERHEAAGFVAGEAEHHALIAGAAGIDAHRDVRRLRVNVALDLAGVGREADVRIDVADLADRVADELFHDFRRQAGPRGDLAGDDGKVGGDEGFAGDPAGGVALPGSSRARHR